MWCRDDETRERFDTMIELARDVLSRMETDEELEDSFGRWLCAMYTPWDVYEYFEKLGFGAEDLVLNWLEYISPMDIEVMGYIEVEE